MGLKKSVLVGSVGVAIVVGCGESRDFEPAATGEAGAPSVAGAHESGGQSPIEGETTAAGGAEPSGVECGADEYQAERACLPLTDCAAGFFVSTPATPSSNRECQACSEGSFSRQPNAAACTSWSVCGANQTQTKEGTATTDTVCVDNPACGKAADRTCSVDCPCESTEGVCTKDEQCVKGASCVAGSGKKVGRTGDTCLADHCNNDKQDGNETSVDCGGDCGCRATLEIVPLKGLPANARWGDFKTMSRDGKVLAGYFGRGQGSYPAIIAADGKVTELPSYGKGGAVASATSDGKVLIGGIACADPPTCSDMTGRVAEWIGLTVSTPLLGKGLGASAASASGSTIVGSYYDSGIGQQLGFISNGATAATISELNGVNGVTPDGKYVLGFATGEELPLLWEAQTKMVTKIGLPEWSNTNAAAINGTTPAIVGSSYIKATDRYVAFRWRGGTLTELGLLPGGQYTYPAALALDGSTVVGLTGTNDFRQAFLWTDKDRLRSLTDELQKRGLEAPVDLKLINALFISDDAKTIVGTEYTDPPSFWRVTLD